MLRGQARTTGRLPCQREAPAFPAFLFLCWGLDSAPTVALQLASTRRWVPDGSRTTAYPSAPARLADLLQSGSLHIGRVPKPVMCTRVEVDRELSQGKLECADGVRHPWKNFQVGFEDVNTCVT